MLKTGLVTILAALVILPGVARAQEAPPPPADEPPLEEDEPSVEESDGPRLELTASFFSRYEVRSHYDDLGLVGRRLGQNDGIAYRARLGLGLAPIGLGGDRSIALRLVPQASGFWGDVSGGLADAALDVHEAVARVAGGPIWVDVGRFEMAYGEHLVIGNVDWHETGRSFDGVRLRGALRDGAYVDAFATFIAEGGLIGATDPVGAGDQYFTGVYAGVGPLIAPELALDGYVLLRIAPETDDGPAPQDFTAAEATLGTRVLAPVGPVQLRAEGGLQLGRRAGVDADVLAYQVDAGALLDIGALAKVGVRGAFASGDDPTTVDDNEGWDQLFPTAHKFFGLMDIMGGRTNVASLTVEGRVSPIEPLLLALDAHTFFRPETPMGVDPYTGFEADAWALWKIGKGLGLRGQMSVFVPSDTGPFATNDVARYYELQLRYDL